MDETLWVITDGEFHPDAGPWSTSELFDVLEDFNAETGRDWQLHTDGEAVYITDGHDVRTVGAAA